MKKKHTLTLILLCTALTLSAQGNYSLCYTNNMNKGNTAFSQGKYSEARTYYTNAKQCEGGNPSAAQQKINACDAKIKALRELFGAKQKAEDPNKQEFEVNGVKFKMIYVEGGTFQMGATPEQDSYAHVDEKPVHSVTLSDFCIGETEVTQALWKAVMGNNPSYFKGDNLPVENVSWNDCQEFIRKLNQLTGKTFRLPTEAEWEYAARGGNKSRGYKYAGGNSIDNVAWYDDNSGNSTHPVKGKRANELGLYDMSGNVWEWCQDWYLKEYYSVSPSKNPQGPASGSIRVLRGGSWRYFTWDCRVSDRDPNGPDYRHNYYGFRLALVP